MEDAAISGADMLPKTPGISVRGWRCVAKWQPVRQSRPGAPAHIRARVHHRRHSFTIALAASRPAPAWSAAQPPPHVKQKGDCPRIFVLPPCFSTFPSDAPHIILSGFRSKSPRSFAVTTSLISSSNSALFLSRRLCMRSDNWSETEPKRAASTVIMVSSAPSPLPSSIRSS